MTDVSFVTDVSLERLLQQWDDSGGDPSLTLQLAKACFNGGQLRLAALFLQELKRVRPDLAEVSRILELLGEQYGRDVSSGSGEQVLSEEEFDVQLFEDED